MKVIQWIPIDNLPPKMYIEALHDDYEGFRILLKGDGEDQKVLRVTFGLPLSYRNIDEGDFLETTYSYNNDLEKWTFFTIEGSEYLSWFHNESHGIHVDDNLIHYAIYSPNDCVDILSASPPKVEWL